VTTHHGQLYAVRHDTEDEGESAHDRQQRHHASSHKAASERLVDRHIQSQYLCVWVCVRSEVAPHTAVPSAFDGQVVGTQA
jgi:hypothetical protein